MDPRSFDAFTRKLATRLPRRGALALLAGGAAPLLVNAPPPARAGCKKVDKTCDKNKDCCDDARCQGKKCKCKSGFTECGGKCFDLDKTDNHCGSCNTNCGAGESCIAGACVEGGCTAELDTCAPDALCIACPDRAGSVCYRDNAGTLRCSVFLFCRDCDEDADCTGIGENARCVTTCPGQCITGTACTAD